MVECADQWQPIALGVLGMITAAMLYFRDPVRFQPHFRDISECISATLLAPFWSYILCLNCGVGALRGAGG